MKPLMILICSSFLLVSCHQKFTIETVSGIYVPKNYIYTFDTIQLTPSGNYTRKLYDKSRNSGWKMTGKWFLGKNGELELRSFFVNFDRDLSLYPELVLDTTGGWSAIFEMNSDTIQFCVGHYEGLNCYHKID